MQDLFEGTISATCHVSSARQTASSALKAKARAHKTDLQKLLAESHEHINRAKALLNRPRPMGRDQKEYSNTWSNWPPHDKTLERLRLLESVIVHANDAILITDATLVNQLGPNILYCNVAFSQMTGYGEEELLGKTPRVLQGRDTDRGSLDKIRYHMARWEPVIVELLNYRKDGSSFWVELSIVPVPNSSGIYTHWISLQRDISDRKAAEDILKQGRTVALEKMALQKDIEARKRVERRLFRAAFHDDLTKLHNRAYFVDYLGALLAHTTSGDDPQWALLFLDLNRFKFINDTLGHDMGDQLLVEVAKRLTSCVVGDDVLARMGGDEFAFLVDIATSTEGAVLLANRISVAFATPFELGDHSIRSSCSIGIAPITVEHREPEAILRDADIAMYRSKRTGGRRPAVFTAEEDAGAVLALSLQSDLLKALHRQEFHLVYQPIFSAEQAYPTAVEALIRWHHPEHGVISPEVFIPLAEECGAARSIGRWVLETALQDMHGWLTLFPDVGIKLNVNVSPNELLDERFVAEVVSTLEAAVVPAVCLELEITEAVFQDRSPHVVEALTILRATGIRLALDDFGIGYSSLGSIDSYPIDTLKIDKTFVMGMSDRPRTRALVEMIITLARALDLDVVAEGVETEAQYEALIAMGCHHFQGYYLARPAVFAETMRIFQSEGA